MNGSNGSIQKKEALLFLVCLRGACHLWSFWRRRDARRLHSSESFCSIGSFLLLRSLSPIVSSLGGFKVIPTTHRDLLWCAHRTARSLHRSLLQDPPFSSAFCRTLGRPPVRESKGSKGSIRKKEALLFLVCPRSIRNIWKGGCHLWSFGRLCEVRVSSLFCCFCSFPLLHSLSSIDSSHLITLSRSIPLVVPTCPSPP